MIDSTGADPHGAPARHGDDTTAGSNPAVVMNDTTAGDTSAGGPDTSDRSAGGPVPAGAGTRAASRRLEAVSDAVGRVFGLVARVRHARAVHPFGVAARATASIDDAPPLPSLAAALTPDASSDGVVLRLSKSIGLPGRWPDVLGLALSVDHGPRGRFDVLLGGVRGGRVLLLPGATWTGRTYTTVLPYRVDGSLVWLGAALPATPRRPADAHDRSITGLEFTLVAAALGSGWRRLGTLTVTEVLDEPVTFDPIVHEHPGVTPWPGWFSAVRRRVYARSREGRHAPGSA